MKTNNVQQLSQDLQALGIQKGDVVLMHSSLKGLGVAGLSPKEVLDGVLDALGQEGTLLLPGLSYLNVNEEHNTFDVKETPVCVGAIPEYFRTHYPICRSLHPTHSVCAIGKYARELTGQQLADNTPVGAHSPFRLLPAYHGKVLMLGCGLRPNTFMHGVEEIVGTDYTLLPQSKFFNVVDEEGHTTGKPYSCHDFDGVEQRYDRLANVMDIPSRTVLNGTAYLIDTQTATKAAAEKMREDLHYFVDFLK